MEEGRVRTIHSHLALIYIWFQLLLAIPSLLMSIGMPPGDTGSPSFEAICFFHADWSPYGAVYGVLLGAAPMIQANLGITDYFLGSVRFKRHFRFSVFGFQ